MESAEGRRLYVLRRLIDTLESKKHKVVIESNGNIRTVDNVQIDLEIFIDHREHAWEPDVLRMTMFRHTANRTITYPEYKIGYDIDKFVEKIEYLVEAM